MSGSGLLSAVHEQLARSLLWGLAAMALLSLLAPLLSYYIDAQEVQRQLRSRGAHEAHLFADSLALRNLTMESELQRIARRPEVDLADQSVEPEKILLQHTHQESALFSGGVALLDLSGHVTSAVPQGRFGHVDGYGQRRWFQKALACSCTVTDRFGLEEEGWVVLVPVQNGAKVVGFVVGVSRAVDQPLAFRLDPAQKVALVDGAEVLFQFPRTGEVSADVLARAGEARSAEGIELSSAGSPSLAFAARVRGTLDLWLFYDAEAVTAPIRRRLFLQLIFLAAVQVTSWMAFALFVRRSLRGFRKMELRVTEEEKMAKLGMAASLIAHEVKNTLNGITAAMSYELSNDSAHAVTARVVRSQLARLSNLARSLLALGRPVHPQRGAVSLEQVTREVVDGLRLLPELADVALSLELEGQTTIDADPALAATAIDNVVRNAIEAAVAAKDMGKVTDPQVRVVARGGPRRAAVTVEDNGGGPPPSFEAHAFEPFVTSKPKGIGLGLTTTRQAMDALRGSITFERTARGSRFVLTFPLHFGPEHP